MLGNLIVRAFARINRAIHSREDSTGALKAAFSQALARCDQAQASALAERALQVAADDPASIRSFGLLAREHARFALAERLLRAALALDETSAEAANDLAVVLMDLGRFEEARVVLEGAVMRKPENYEAHFNLAMVHQKLERFDEAKAVLDSALGLKPDCPDTRVAVAQVLHALGRYGEAEDICRKVLGERPDHAYAHARLGATLAAAGRYPDCAPHFEAATRLSEIFSACSHVHFDAGWFGALESNPPAGLPPMRVIRSGALQSVSYVVGVCCDGIYLEKYGRAFLRSFLQNSAATGFLHFHVIDGDAEIGLMTTEFDEYLRDGRLAFSRESTGARVPVASRAPYYASARFFRAGELLDLYGRPLLLLDVDLVVERDLLPAVAALSDADTGLCFKEYPDSPWMDVMAGVMLVNPTAAARHFVDTVAAYIGRCFATGRALWQIDQIALYCTLHTLRRQDRALRLANVKPIYDRDLFHVGHSYDHHLSNPRYVRYLQ